MSEEKIETPLEEQTEATSEEGAGPKPDIAGELQEFGRQLAAATKALMESPEAQEFKTQLQKGLDSLSNSVNKMAKQARETEVGQKVESGVTEVSTTMKERRVFETIGESVASALKTVNQSLGQVAEKAEKRAEAARAKKSAPQQIEIVDVEAESEESEA